MLKGRSQVSPETSLLQAEQPQLSQPVLTGEVFYPSDQFCAPPLDVLQQVHVSPVLRTPHLDAVLQVRSHTTEQKGRITSRPVGHSALDAAQDMVGLLGSYTDEKITKQDSFEAV